MSDLPHCHGALALEVAAPPARAWIARDEADALAQYVAADLARLVPEVQALELVLAGAHFDPAELLRPDWPVHAALEELARRAPHPGQAGARVIAFGAHQQAMPLATLTPDLALAGGPLRLVPWRLRGDPARMQVVAPLLEACLLDIGMAGAATALFAQEAFAARIEHARHLTVSDLCALTAMQYEHAGLAPLWPLLEAALFGGEESVWLDAPPEPLLCYTPREVRVARPGRAAWHGASASQLVPQAAQAARARQFAAVVQAHGIALRWIEVDAGTDARAALQA